jgi:hypothetical protein
MLVVMLLMFLLGFVIDFIEITYIIVPIVAPVLLAMGLDPLWLGIMIAMNLQTSFLTPPFGFALFYLRGVAPDSIQHGHDLPRRDPVGTAAGGCADHPRDLAAARHLVAGSGVRRLEPAS